MPFRALLKCQYFHKVLSFQLTESLPPLSLVASSPPCSCGPWYFLLCIVGYWGSFSPLPWREGRVPGPSHLGFSAPNISCAFHTRGLTSWEKVPRESELASPVLILTSKHRGLFVALLTYSFGGFCWCVYRWWIHADKHNMILLTFCFIMQSLRCLFIKGSFPGKLWGVKRQSFGNIRILPSCRLRKLSQDVGRKLNAKMCPCPQDCMVLGNVSAWLLYCSQLSHTQMCQLCCHCGYLAWSAIEAHYSQSV